MLLAHSSQLTATQNALIVDVGYGAEAWTALEMLTRWQTVAPSLRLLGLEIDPERVANAQPYSQPPIATFEQGGFNVAENIGKNSAQIIRAYNVLRQYHEADVPEALYQLSQALVEGGMLIEGTSTPTGRMVTFDLYQKRSEHLVHQALIFGTNFKSAPPPIRFQTILPKRLIHHMLDEHPARFFHDWERAFSLARGAGFRSYRIQWQQAINFLAQFGYPIDTRKRITRRGFLVLKASLLG